MRPDLARFRRVSLAHRPTPLEPLDRLSALLGGPRLWVKRDDCTGLALGGNKTRKLEFLLADAVEQAADTVVTVGGVQSNHARQTAAAAARLGLKCELVLPAMSVGHGPAYDSNGNVLLDRLLGAKVHLVGDAAETSARIDEVLHRLRSEGRTPYLIPVGGSTPVGALGYVDAAFELVDQAAAREVPIDAVVITTGSCTTHAGVLVGLAAVDHPAPVFGISVNLNASKARDLVAQRAHETAELLSLNLRDLDRRVQVDDSYLGAGYGQPTDAMLEALQLLAQYEGLLLDPVYTGKTMSGLIDLVRRGRFAPTDNVLFWHTGGTPALFAYEALLSNTLAGEGR